MSPHADLPEPAVSPDQYHRGYYLETCAGADEWRESEGRMASALYPGMLSIAGLNEGESVVDIGTGRGELVAAAIELGAARATGVDYSPAAVDLARQTLAARGLDDRARVVLADARAIPLDGGDADLVTMLDVIEHLDPAELTLALAEALRLLRPGGRLLVHTMPNRLVYDLTYRVQRALWPPRWSRWPKDPRQDVERTMHVNEQTLRSLTRTLAGAGFVDVRGSYGQWMHTSFVPSARAQRLYHRLASRKLTAPLGVIDLFAHAVKRAP